MIASGRAIRSTGVRAGLVAVATAALLVTSAGGAGAVSARPGEAPKITGVTATSGPSTGKVRVTVTGSNLSHVAAVTFGGAKGTAITVATSHTSLVVTAPAHTIGAVDVRVRTSAGSSAISSHDVFTYQAYAPIAGGGDHSCAEAGGTVRCWGSNTYGELGDGTTTSSETPVAVSGLSHVVAISAGYYHTCALNSDGTVRCWGYNSTGQLGNNTTTEAHSPVKVLGLSHVVEISSGYSHTCAVISDGTARCWGDNSDGELGNGTTTDSHTPVQVIGVAHATALSAGFYTGCAVVSGGTVRCWGDNTSGELGNGTQTDSDTATPVAGLTDVSAISDGGYFNCAVVARHVFCWGENTYDEIGDGTTTSPRLTPTAVAKLGSISALSAGGYHSLVRLAGGSLRAWGDNGYGQLGDGTTTNSPLPVPVTG